MYIFKKLRDESNSYDITTIELTADATTLTELTEEFVRFVIACGFVVKKADLVEEIEDAMVEYQKAIDEGR